MVIELAFEVAIASERVSPARVSSILSCVDQLGRSRIYSLLREGIKAPGLAEVTE